MHLDVNDASNGSIIVSEENVTTIGGFSRQGPTQGTKGLEIGDQGYLNAQSKVVLDVRGSIRTDGYINFYNQIGSGFQPKPQFWSNVNVLENIPSGSLFLKPAGGTPGAEGVYYKNFENDIIAVGTGGGSGSGGDVSGSAVFDFSLNKTGGFAGFIIQKNANSTKSGGTPLTFSGETLTVVADTQPLSSGIPGIPPGSGTTIDRLYAFQNALTVRAGNLSVCGISGEDRRVITEDGNPISKMPGNAATGIPDALDVSGGIIWAERQLLIGPNKFRNNWAVIDAQTVAEAPALLSYNYDLKSPYITDLR